MQVPPPHICMLPDNVGSHIKIIGVHRGNGKENGNCSVGFRVESIKLGFESLVLGDLDCVSGGKWCGPRPDKNRTNPPVEPLDNPFMTPSIKGIACGFHLTFGGKINLVVPKQAWCAEDQGIEILLG